MQILEQMRAIYPNNPREMHICIRDCSTFHSMQTFSVVSDGSLCSYGSITYFLQLRSRYLLSCWPVVWLCRSNVTSGTVLIVSFSLTQVQFYVSIEMIKPKK